MAEVRDELERAFKAVLELLPEYVLVQLPVVAGSSPNDQPDNFVRVTSQEAEHAAGGVYRVDMEITVIVELREGSDVYAAEWFGVLCRYFDSKTCPLRAYRDTGLKVFGYRVMGQDEKRGTRQFAQTLKLKVGAAAIG